MPIDGPRPERTRFEARRAGSTPNAPPTTFRDRMVALRNVPPFLGLVWRTSPSLTVWTLVVRLLRALLPVMTLYVGKLIIDEVVLVAGGGAAGGLAAWRTDGRLHHLAWLLAAEFGLAVASDVLGRVTSLIDGLLAERFSISTSVRLMEHAATLDLQDFEDSESQDKLERARRQASGRMALMSQLFSQAQDAITILSLAAGLALFTPWLILLLLAALVPAFLGEAHFSAQGYALAYTRTADQRTLDYLRRTGASAETAKEVKIFGLHAFLIDRYRQLAGDYYRATRALAVRRAGWGTLLTTIGTLGYYGAFAYLSWRTVAGDFSIGDLTFGAASFRRLRGLLEGLLAGFSQLAGQALYLDDLFSFFELTPAIRSPENPRPFPTPIRQGFVFEDVGFCYPGSETWAVRHMDFTLRAGEVLALVGENGAGKTTLVKLLTRLYDPNEGRILLDGHDLREYDLDAVRANLGVIFQDFVRYDLTAAENIAVGRMSQRDDRARIEAAAQRSLADEVVRRLPKGYDQVLGRRFRGAVDLSGGEWQKLALARAYMRDAQLLVLDEPTAALDARAEFEVFQRFKELMHGKTGVLISHRFSSVRMADRILVLVDGTVEAAGTHEELLAQHGRYAELFELQAAGYR
ncbi:MAG: ABC transporter ATP-binding protein [Gemmatimonadetes bacterium]|nr:ABC transporter ATP-binding protein [Gemmatimonadota bacterium]MBK9408541.1 ABC transporter ATP-binding protein [Gemmatimonadota bacterium]MBK9978285.1 ABC transporter ATP-binding protein [Gemmatimonadota bacterium]